MEQEHTSSGFVRRATQSSREWVTRRIHETIPGLTADHVTIAGGVGVGAGVALITARNISTEPKDHLLVPAVVFIVGGVLTDSIDGELAKLTGTHGNGAALDAGVDRINAIMLGIARMSDAFSRDSTPGEVLSAVSTMSGLVPSYLRAELEENGYKPPEEGRDIVSFGGNHVGRTALQVAALGIPTLLSLPKIQGLLEKYVPSHANTITNFPWQETLDTVSTLMNLKLSYDRAQMVRNPTSYDMGQTSTQEMKSARQKKRMYRWLMGIGVSSMALTYIGLHNEEVKEVISRLYYE